jgi:hypothetical protein
MAEPANCFVIMPFGEKVTLGDIRFDFDAFYHQVICDAIGRCGSRLDP